MTTVELMAALELRRVTLSIKGSHLRVDAPKSALTPMLRTELTQQKVQIMKILGSRTEGQPTSASENADAAAQHRTEKTLWPEACVDSLNRFGQPHAVLFPLIGKIVETPSGRGKLFNILSAKDGVVAGVILEGEDRVTRIPPADLKPSDGRLK